MSIDMKIVTAISGLNWVAGSLKGIAEVLDIVDITEIPIEKMKDLLDTLSERIFIIAGQIQDDMQNEIKNED